MGFRERYNVCNYYHDHHHHHTHYYHIIIIIIISFVCKTKLDLCLAHTIDQNVF